MPMQSIFQRLIRWLNRSAELTHPELRRLEFWKNLAKVPQNIPFGEARYVVVDVETSGLNLLEDKLISIGAVAVVNGRVVVGDSFSVVLQQATVSQKENILLHGIGGAAQLEGVPAREALLEFLDYLGKSPLVAFHVTFDQTMIRRAMRQFLGFSFKHVWLDLAYIMPALNPVLAARYRSLDDWINHFEIRNEARHNALADALVTAQLFQVAMHQARNKNIPDLSGLRDLEKAQRWVSRVD